MQALQDIKKTVSDIVREDYRAADVFKKHGINYCCGGKMPLEEACLLKQLNYPDILLELEQATKTVTLPNNLQFDSWKIDFLIDYIINVHHSYLKNNLPLLQTSLVGFVDSHRKQHPELESILEQYTSLSALILAHNQHEEEIIFPYIKLIENTHRRKETYGNLFVRTLRKPLSNIEIEHKKIGGFLTSLRSLTNNYRFPANACTNHQVIFHKLREVDNDLLQHIHLENNILFPKAIEIEQQLLQF